MMKLRLMSMIVIAVLSIATISVGCSSSEEPTAPVPQPKIERWSGLVQDLRARWTATEAIDLVRGAAVIVRAYTESYNLASIMGNAEYVYPGFDRAVAKDERDGTGPRPDITIPQSNPLVGNMLNFIARIETSGRDVEAVVCHWYFAMGVAQPSGVIAPYARTSQPVLTRISMTAPDSQGSGLGEPQKGPLAAPIDDVFGGWRINSRDYGSADVLPGPDWPAYAADRDACLANAPAPAERREFLVSGEHSRAEYPTLPAEPGWPRASAG
jgi:hypothetical protein